MSIFRDFFVKEKPVFTGITRGVGGFGFGKPAADGRWWIFCVWWAGRWDKPNGWTYHTFKSSGSLVISGGLKMQNF